MEKENFVHAKTHPEFVTITCLKWKPVLADDRFKDIIISSLSFLSMTNRATIYAFVIMQNHMHLIWQILGDHSRENVQRDFLRFTSQQILKILRNENSSLQRELRVEARDRKYQIWERNSLGISLWSEKVMRQKIDYIHLNPVKAGWCEFPEEYKYSSAGFYSNGERRWEFLVHIDG
ncbi:REP element-mobilizing transposase RayT [Chryseolinea serpens]|uniref:REP element-mobilizing transposase RayT n=1 Tax=Chryseolinea serpens TaxID=947013 RepID=A0A1M5QJU6_9BACT|nr:transposase [Chryseolinea serpens]SHH14059.1 REP element-mobilizing transposase RayT [Chryseolinea serpens]